MNSILPFAAAAALLLAASSAFAEPQIPTWANPYPAEPVATDGSPLVWGPTAQAWSALAADHLVVGRSAGVRHHTHR